MENKKYFFESSCLERKKLLTKGESSKTCSNEEYQMSAEVKYCTYFFKYNYCKYGDSCKFTHYTQPPTENNLQLFSGNKKNSELKQNSRKLSNSKSHIRVNFNKDNIRKKQVCRYFKSGNCDKGANCSYQHVLGNKNSDKSENLTVSNQVKDVHVPICHYFKRGSCKRGDVCKFYHSNIRELPSRVNNAAENVHNSDGEKSGNIVSRDSINFEENAIENYCNKDYSSFCVSKNVIDVDHSRNLMNSSRFGNNDYSQAKKFYDVTTISDSEIIKLRDTEISQLKKRYPKCEVLEENQLAFTFEPSDPDWPFDLKSLDLKVCFPAKYPVEVCKISILLKNNIPEILHRFLNQSISDWLCKRHEDYLSLKQIELVFRPFLKWFDKNLEDLFIYGLRKVKKDLEAKSCGIEYVPPETIFTSTNGVDNAPNHLDENQPTRETDFIDEHKETDFIEAKAEKEAHSEKPRVKSQEVSLMSSNNKSNSNSALKLGVKVLFVGLELVEGVAMLTCSKLAVTLSCIRCKTPGNMKCIPGKNGALKCSKCSKVLECTFNSSVLHQFSNVAGNLFVVEGQVVDINLVESSFLLDCLNCSKQIPINGLHYGQKQKRWCMFCNEKLIFSIESIKFQAVSSNYVAGKSAPMKKTEKKKDPLIKEGEPLPAYGTCKHYKKSHRWLRFPCCGRLYPCDVCHDEKEKDNHEMKFASRMICGFCSKEQPYSKDKPCSFCSGTLTAKSGTHWEGGKGCRNKIKMARDDKHKYAGTSKTVSKKASSIKSGKKK